jgi:hypothetical protein
MPPSILGPQLLALGVLFLLMKTAWVYERHERPKKTTNSLCAAFQILPFIFDFLDNKTILAIQ